MVSSICHTKKNIRLDVNLPLGLHWKFGGIFI
jgi:hypothetical protein